MWRKLHISLEVRSQTLDLKWNNGVSIYTTRIDISRFRIWSLFLHFSLHCVSWSFQDVAENSNPQAKMKDLLFIKIHYFHFLQLKIIFGLFFQIFECSRQSRIFSHVWIFKPDTEHFWRKINFLNCAGKLQTRYIDVEQQDAKIFLFFLCHTVCRAVTVIWGQPSKKVASNTPLHYWLCSKHFAKL